MCHPCEAVRTVIGVNLHQAARPQAAERQTPPAAALLFPPDRAPCAPSCACRFSGEDALHAVFAFVDAQEENDALGYALASNFPRRVFAPGGAEAGTSVSALGLTPQALLFVQPADS